MGSSSKALVYSSFSYVHSIFLELGLVSLTFFGRNE